MGHNGEQKRVRSLTRSRSREHWESDVTFLNRATAVELSPERKRRSMNTAQLLMYAGRVGPVCRGTHTLFSSPLCILLLDLAKQRLAVPTPAR